MKITSFNPLICTRHPEEVVKLFEALGFATTHTKENVNGEDISEYRMKDGNGFHVDVSAAGDFLPFPGDATVIRINVDDIDEALKFFTDRGFFDPLGNEIHSGSSRDMILVAPSGFPIRLIQHLK